MAAPHTRTHTHTLCLARASPLPPHAPPTAGTLGADSRLGADWACPAGSLRWVTSHPSLSFLTRTTGTVRLLVHTVQHMSLRRLSGCQYLPSTFTEHLLCAVHYPATVCPMGFSSCSFLLFFSSPHPCFTAVPPEQLYSPGPDPPPMTWAAGGREAGLCLAPPGILALDGPVAVTGGTYRPVPARLP